MWQHKKGYILVSIISSLILFSALGSVYSYAEDNNKHILILNSYNEGFTWTDEQSEGIVGILKSSNMNYDISVEYMDWKYYPSPENLDHLYQHLAFKYSKEPIDLIIATDDIAVEFALKYRDELFSQAPIIFSGVNEEGIEKTIKGHSDITGIVEDINPEATIKLALEIMPKLKTIYLIYDQSESGLSTGKMTIEAAKRIDPYINVISMHKDTYKEIIEDIQKAEKDSIVLMTTYSQDASGMFVDFQDLCTAVSQKSSIPIFQLYDFGMGHGCVGGNVQSGRLQGIEAGELALRVIQGEAISNLPIQRNETTRNMFDYYELKRFHIPISELPKDSEIINKPFSFVEKYKKLIGIVLVIFSILILFISILLMYIRNINKMKKQLQDLSYLDTLTNLPNRLALSEKLLSLTEQKSNLKVALMFIDADNFKYINDTLGHLIGDRIIKEIGLRIAVTAGADAVAYRLGGDEFVVLFEGYEEDKLISTYAERILQSFKESFFVGENVLQTTVSIGIALYPEHSKTVNDLIKYADIAMYKAKEEGRNKAIMYNSAMNDVMMERMNIEKYLRGAMKKNQFSLNYQPQVDIKTGKITGFEALVRWNSPELGFVSTQKFIAVAEDTHMIIALGDWVIESACKFIKRLHQEGHRDYCMSINVSIIQLMQDNFVDNVMGLLKKLEVDPKYIELEITETVLAKSFDIICNKLELLRDKGINIALDDFGKGYSSLNYLKQLPITTLKIDKVFIDAILSEGSDKVLTGFIVLLGREMGLCVVAEGVETQEQLDYLAKKKCDKFQGYLAYMPLCEEDIIDTLIKQSTL